MRIHFIAIGGAVMHNLALTLHENGHQITGSDDEIYNPSRDRLAKHGLLPKAMGWYPEQLTDEIDVVILGMHARKDNPELARAKVIGLRIYSYPEYIFEHAKQKLRVVVAGSHGKTTTTSMILHILRYHNMDFDYLVGAQLEGFDLMARLSDAPLIVMEGDEYPASPIDLRPKIMHYRPQIAIITGIAWDHINVFPTFESYTSQFDQFIDTIPETGHLIYFEGDKHLKYIVESKQNPPQHTISYQSFEAQIQSHQTSIFRENGEAVPLQIFGQHNLANLKAAYHACKAIGLTDEQFFEAIPTFKGAAKRLQLLREKEQFIAYLDFAHAPSKVEATIKAFKGQYAERPLTACLELHTFSSLNKNFLPQYANTMNDADEAIVFYSPHTLEMKRLEPIHEYEVQAAFQHPNLRVVTEPQHFKNILQDRTWESRNLLLMSSGTFGGLDYKQFVEGLEV
jgi:UDP-N-acetylmuramate: L-alanyl-gamma-D-glutamyl-meso-diaminopimelate ligase